MDKIPTGADDPALLRAFWERGDRQALNILFARHADAAYRVALRCCRNAEDTQDAVQTAFIEVLRHAAAYRGESAVRAWIFGFVVNACRHKAREEGRRAAREEKASVSGELAAEDRALQESVRAAVRELPEHYRLPVWLHYCEGLSSPEVADALSLSENTVRSQLSRGVEELRLALSSSGLAVTAVAVVSALASAAVESAPASLTASLSNLGTHAAPVAKVGLVAKLGAGTMAAAAILSTAVALWSGGVPDDVRPPEFARIDEKVREWEPRPEERRFDEIGWAKNLPEAIRLARESGRGVFVVAHVGHLNTGRTDGGSMSFRGGPLSDPEVMGLLNSRFVPVYVNSSDRTNRELDRVSRDSLKAGLGSGTERLYFLDPQGNVTDSIHMCTVKTPELLDKLNQHASGAAGPTLSPPVPQAAAPSTGQTMLHVTTRYLDRQGHVEQGQASYHAFPAEEWVPLTPADEGALVPRKDAPPGAAWTVDLGYAGRLLSRFYPLTGNLSEPEKNPIRAAGLSARVVAGRRDVAWIRLDGRVSLDHSLLRRQGLPAGRRGSDRLSRVRPRRQTHPQRPPGQRSSPVRPRELRGRRPLRSVGESTISLLLAALLRVCAQDAGDRILFDFEKPEDAEPWSNMQIPDPASADPRTRKEPPAPWALSTQHATSGSHSLKITFDGGRWPTITTALPPEDGMSYPRLTADLTVTRSCRVGLRVLQQKSSRKEGWAPVISRWTKTIFAQPGPNALSEPLHRNDGQAIIPKFGSVVAFEILLYSPHAGESIWIDNVRLTSRKEKEAETKREFRVLGTDWTVSGVTELGKKLKDPWTRPVPTTVDQVEAEVRALHERLKAEHPKARLSVFRDGENGYSGWTDAYFNSHGPDGMTFERSEDGGRSETAEMFMRHRSPWQRVDLPRFRRGRRSTPPGSSCVAREKLPTRSTIRSRIP